MKLSEFMKAMAARTEKTGEVQAEDYVLAVDCGEGGAAASVGDYDVAAVHIENTGASITANTNDKNYLYEGAMTVRSSPRRSFSPAGQRFIGDAFQDFCCSHKIAFGTGSDVVRDYVYFCIATGKGEKGRVTINTTNDGSAASGNVADFAVTMNSIGTPTEYVWSAD